MVEVNVLTAENMHTAFIGIGANLGEPLKQCQRALELIRQIPQTSIVACSSFYRSEPLVPEGQNPEGIPQYVNAVCQLITGLGPQDLLNNLQEIEKTMGRIKRTKWASREIDLDLLFYDDRIIREEGITIPHPELHKRGFVIRPLREIAPDWVHPLSGKSVADLEKNLEDKCKFSLIQLM